MSKAKIYLSPSSQDNPCQMKDCEKNHCHDIANLMLPHLARCGIEYMVRPTTMTLSDGVKQSNAYKPDMHFALHSNGSNGVARGVHCYYKSDHGKQIAQICMDNFCYPYAQVPGAQKYAIKNDAYTELVSITSPSVIMEIAFHDNLSDAKWIHDNKAEIAESLVRCICKSLNIPYVEATADGWVQRDGKWYYYQNGKSLTSWQSLSWSSGRDWFYFDSGGVMLTGLQMLQWSGGTDLFFFDLVTGTMLHDKDLELVIGGNQIIKMRADSNGVIKVI